MVLPLPGLLQLPAYHTVSCGMIDPEPHPGDRIHDGTQCNRNTVDEWLSPQS